MKHRFRYGFLHTTFLLTSPVIGSTGFLRRLKRTAVTNQKFRVVYVTENKYFSFLPFHLSLCLSFGSVYSLDKISLWPTLYKTEFGLKDM